MKPRIYLCPDCDAPVYFADTRPGFCIRVEPEPDREHGTWALTLDTTTGELKARTAPMDWGGRIYRRHYCDTD